MDSDNLSEEVFAALRQYGWLRDEINQSNRLQNRVIFAQAILVGIGFGTKWSGAIGGNGNVSEAIGLAVFFLPLLVITSTGVWLLEQARVMRAGNFLHHLEYYINQQLESNPVAWESWLRGDWEGKDRDTDGLRKNWFWTRFTGSRYVYDWAFIIGYPLYFVILAIASSVLVYQLASNIPFPEFVTNTSYIIIVYGVIITTFTIVISLASFLQIRHEYHDEADSFSQYNRFLKHTFGKEADRVLAKHLFSQHKEDVEELSLKTDKAHEQFEEIIELAKDGEEYRRLL